MVSNSFRLNYTRLHSFLLSLLLKIRWRKADGDMLPWFHFLSYEGSRKWVESCVLCTWFLGTFIFCTTSSSWDTQGRVLVTCNLAFSYLLYAWLRLSAIVCVTPHLLEYGGEGGRLVTHYLNFSSVLTWGTRKWVGSFGYRFVLYANHESFL